MKRRLFSKTNLVFFCLVVLAFSLRSIYLSQTIKFIQPGMGSDAHFYLEWAKDIVRGNFIGSSVFYALPFYPYFLSLAYIFAGGDLFSLILLQLLIGAINCGLLYILGKKLFNNQVGIIASCIACAYSLFIFYDRMLLPESGAIFLSLLLTLLILKIRDNPSLRGWLGAGFLFGLCTLARASFFLTFIFILGWMGYEYRKRPLKQLFLYGWCFILPFFLTLGTVTLRNYLVANEPVVICAHSGINFYIGNNSQANGLFKVPPYMRPTQSGLIEDARILAERISARRLKAGEASRFWFRRAFSFIRKQPLNYVKLLGKKLLFFCNGKEHIDDIEYYIYNEGGGLLKLPLFAFSLIFPLAILGMFLARPAAKKVIILYIFIFSLALATISFFINSRYRLIVVPYLIIFSAFAFWRTVKMAKNRQYKGFISTLVLFCLLYFFTNIKVTDVTALPNSSFHYNKGVIFTDQGRYRKAEEEFQYSLKINPLDFMSYLGLGNVYYQMQDFPKAIDNYKKSLSINPYFYNAHFNLGIIYKEMGKDEESEEQFKKVLALKPEDSASHYNLGRIYQEKGLFDLALREYRKALKLEPGHREILQAIREVEDEGKK